MSLHEQYKALLKAGMPEMERLSHQQNLWFILPTSSHVVLLGTGASNESDARDLVEAHAMRWWLEGEHSFMDGNHQFYQVWSNMTEAGGSGETILDAIVEAVK